MATATDTLKVVHRNEDDSCMTFLLENEDHTLGNALRYIILKNPAVQFCGYAVPHPSERTIHVRIQMYSGSAIDAIEKGLHDLRDVFEHIHASFEDTIKIFKAETSATA